MVYATGGVVKLGESTAVEVAVFFCLFFHPPFKEQCVVREAVGLPIGIVACFVRVDIGVGEGLAQHCVFVVRSEVEEGNLLKPPRFFGGLPRIYPDFGAVFGIEELDARVVLGEDELLIPKMSVSVVELNLNKPVSYKLKGNESPAKGANSSKKEIVEKRRQRKLVSQISALCPPVLGKQHLYAR